MIVYISVYMLVFLSISRAALQWEPVPEKYDNSVTEMKERLQQFLFPQEKSQSGRLRRINTHGVNKREDNYKQLSSTDLPTESVNIEENKNQDKSEINSNQSFLFMPSLFPGTKSSLFVIAKTSTMRKDPWMTIPDRLILNDILKEINLEMMSPLLLLPYPKIHDNNTKYYKQYTNNVRNLPRFFTPKSFVSKPYVTEGTSKRNRKTLSGCPENESNANQSPTTVRTQTTPISPGRNCFTFPRNIPRIKKTQTDD